MAGERLFNALAHNRDDHAKHFSFFGSPAGWQLAPAYDLTFANTSGRGNEHTSAFSGSGQPSRKAIMKVCEPFSFLEPALYIEQTLDALSTWSPRCTHLDVDKTLSAQVFTALTSVWKAF
ncbi:HipA domain-containing protein [Pseudomonas kitaguniensis]|uniref:HipA domain-containing protein n=1 Tax=Pseudomonas kitaguniensis TaxID=2607908 RepID=UPI003BA3180D